MMLSEIFDVISKSAFIVGLLKKYFYISFVRIFKVIGLYFCKYKYGIYC